MVGFMSIQLFLTVCQETRGGNQMFFIPLFIIKVESLLSLELALGSPACPGESFVISPLSTGIAGQLS